MGDNVFCYIPIDWFLPGEACPGWCREISASVSSRFLAPYHIGISASVPQLRAGKGAKVGVKGAKG